MSSTNMSYYAIVSDYLLAVKSGSRWAVSSDGLEWVGGPLSAYQASSWMVGNPSMIRSPAQSWGSMPIRSLTAD